MPDNMTFLGDVTLTLWKYSLLFSCLTVFDWVLTLLCLGVSLQGVDSFIQTKQSFELHGLEEDASKVSLMFHAFVGVIVIFLGIKSKQILNDFIFRIISFFRNSISVSTLRMIVLSTRVSYWFSFCEFSFSLILFFTKFHVLVFMSCSRIFWFLKFGMTVHCVDQVESIWEPLRFCLVWDKWIKGG